MIGGSDNYSDETIFKMEAVRYLEFSKVAILVTWRVLSMVLLVYTKYRVNRKITGGDIAKRRFSIWQLSARFEFHIFL